MGASFVKDCQVPDIAELCNWIILLKDICVGSYSVCLLAGCTGHKPTDDNCNSHVNQKQYMKRYLHPFMQKQDSSVSYVCNLRVQL